MKKTKKVQLFSFDHDIIIYTYLIFYWVVYHDPQKQEINKKLTNNEIYGNLFKSFANYYQSFLPQIYKNWYHELKRSL